MMSRSHLIIIIGLAYNPVPYERVTAACKNRAAPGAAMIGKGYDHILYDSSNERDFAKELEIRSEAAVYVKLPNGFYISTPVGHYNPDWAIAFYEGSVKHIYFVAETKGSLDSMNFNGAHNNKT